ncbi:hypothetical protein Ddep01_03039 [Deinococcus depolymerans]
MGRQGWTSHVFGNLVKNINDYFDSVRDGILPYVAGPHISLGKIMISAYGSTADDDFPPTFKRRFHPGDVLLHSRGIEKLAVVDRIGVTGEKLFVLRTRDQSLLLQEFLPWLLLSARVQAHLQDNFTGSVNKFLNWKPLSDMQVALPPIEEQKRLADLLWASETHQEALVKENTAVKVLRKKLLDQVLSAMSVETLPLESLIKPDTTITYGIVQAGPEVENGVPYIRVSDMTDGQLSLEGMKRTAPEIAAKFKRSRVETGDLVVALRGRTGLTLKVPDELAGANLTQGTARVAINSEQINPDFVVAVMNSAWMASEINRNAKGSTFTELTLAALRNLPVPRLGLEKEAELLRDLRAMSHAEVATAHSLEKLRRTKSTLLSSIFGDPQ